MLLRPSIQVSAPSGCSQFAVAAGRGIILHSSSPLPRQALSVVPFAIAIATAGRAWPFARPVSSNSRIHPLPDASHLIGHVLSGLGFGERRVWTFAMAFRALYTVGFWIRETGQALDRAGCRLQGNYIFREELSRHRPLMNLFDKKPNVAEDAFVAPSASLVGDVQVGTKSSIWYGCVLRGDANSIRIGSETNIQDHSLVTVGGSRFSGGNAPTVIGNKVTIGHSAVIHACTVEDGAFVGMGATLLDGVVVEQGAFVAAGSMVTENTRIPAGQIWAGNPAKFLRALKGDEGAFIPKSADNYSELGAAHAEANAKSFHELTTGQVKPEEQCPELTGETTPAASAAN